MIEISSKRTLNSKHFDNGNGTNKMDAHSGHIHYFNKLGVGDGEVRFREIDWTLIWDDKKRGWGFEFHSFQPFLPEYADEWVEFRDLFDDKDQTIRYKAVCSHVKGRLVIPEKDDPISYLNYVIYDDAFGKGIDYILYFTRSTLTKVVRVREEFKGKEDQTFDFEIEFPKQNDKELDVYRADSKDVLSVELAKPIFTEKTEVYKLDLTTAKEFDTPKQMLIGSDKLDGKEWFTYLRGFKAWDSGEDKQTISIKVDYFIETDKRFLRKIIPAKFLVSSSGDVFTDTTTSYNAGAGDGSITGSNAVWATCRGAATGDNAYPTDSYLNSPLTGKDGAGIYIIYRAFFPIDTSGLDDGATISAATFKYRAYAYGDNDNDGDDFVSVVQTSQASNTTLTTADFDAISFTEGINSGARIDISTMSGDKFWTWALNSTGIGWISKTGYTKLGLLEGHDVLNHAYAGSNGTSNRMTGYFSETTSDPYLEITYTIGATGTNMQLNISDSWKDITKLQINIGDSWKEVTKAQINIGDTWKEIF